ncbi:class I SAM-dependent DNA methyltransferase [Salinarimonas chemoclinalis]|uniref:class I SAM-dependent DNA methyltransferase n=1 Tax=Salinarimonas chemoclinalis TaxID=3241599 RepID=UPI003558B001
MSCASVSNVESFITAARGADGSERANYQLFVRDLCDLLGVPAPTYSSAETALNDYVFERRVDFAHPDGSRTPGFIDCYKRDCFVLEAKQSGKRKAGADGGPAPGWDRVLMEARRQAENYARALPVSHGYPPLLIVLDVGRSIALFADFSGQGKNYVHYPDRARYRIGLDDLRDEAVRERLRRAFVDPLSLDPTREAAEVTRDVAERLARIARRLERRHEPKDVAEFLMRCVFTMFAKDVGLLPREKLLDLLAAVKREPGAFVPAMESLWAAMNAGRYESRLMTTLLEFNGGLFAQARALPLAAEEIAELEVAARKTWANVEPTIFGTLLERALDPRERASLGAHYTPRTYVERLVIHTVIEPLRAEWEIRKNRADEQARAGDVAQALGTIRIFHHELCTVRVLDPACGTGNFLYVALELMKRLEGEVLDALDALGQDQGRLAMDGETVSPKQFLGLEINPRAVAIAELVLWIGFLKWQLKTGGPHAVAVPVLKAYGTIREQDAILAHDGVEPVLDAAGAAVTRWDGIGCTTSAANGERIPDPAARIPLLRYRDPRPAPWPEAEFVVGNPPFIGGKDLRAQLGNGYAEACWTARPHLPGGADFVMHFWDEAATRLTAAARDGGARRTGKGAGTQAKAGAAPVLRRFGFITTNSITQTFSRRVIERHRAAKSPLHLVFAVPDHPWYKGADAAAVRIAMTVCARGEGPGVLARIVSERHLDSDTPQVELARREGVITGNLSIGADLGSATALLANEALCSPGVKLHGAGFIVTPQKAASLGLGRVPGLENHILPYRNGRDLTGRPRGAMVIDLHGLKAEEVLERFPEVYQHVLETVKPGRQAKVGASKDMNEYATKWWLFGKVRTELRSFTSNLPRYIATTETAKHRLFQFLDTGIRPDNMLVAIGLPTPEHLAVLSSRLHVVWAIAAGGWMGIGNDPRYSKTRTFDPFPFPACLDPAHPDAESRATLRRLGERLDAMRKARIARHPHLTLTGLYNVLERLRGLDWGTDNLPLTPAETDVKDAGLVSVLKDLHDSIDRAAFAAYGWEDLADHLVGRPGATTPVDALPEGQAEVEAELLARLVALNRERAQEEADGRVRWLRPGFQVPRLGGRLPQPAQEIFPGLDDVVLPVAARPRWPADGLDQIRLVRDVLARAPAPVRIDAIAVSFDGRADAHRRRRVAAVLETLVATGSARFREEGEGEPRSYFVPR